MSFFSFSNDLNKFTLKLKNGNKKTIRATAMQAYKMVTENTPVASGRAKGNWFIGVDAPNRDVTKRFSRKPYGVPAAEYRVQNEVSKIKGTQNNVYISNNLPYIMRLETGYSRQAPAGMVAITVEQLKQHIESGKLKL